MKTVSILSGLFAIAVSLVLLAAAISTGSLVSMWPDIVICVCSGVLCIATSKKP